jgi:predicted nucleic acid-binding protein
MAYLLDTNVLSEFLKKVPNQDVIRWVSDGDEMQQHISSLTIAEIQKGISKLPASQRKEDLMIWLDSVIKRYQDRILSFGLKTARIWGNTMAAIESQGRPLPVVDSLLAATALEHDLTIVTRNATDFEPTGVRILNLWQ